MTEGKREKKENQINLNLMCVIVCLFKVPTSGVHLSSVKIARVSSQSVSEILRKEKTFLAFVLKKQPSVASQRGQVSCLYVNAPLPTPHRHIQV